MAITYPLTLPVTPVPRSIVLRPQFSVNRAVSPYTFHSQTQENPGQRWGIDVLLPPMKRAAAEPWISTLLALNGRKGTFKVPIYAHNAPLGSWAGTAQVAGASQTGQTLNIDGLTPSQTGICKAGDYFNIGDQLYKVLFDADSSGGGAASIDIWPALRSSPADNALLVVNGAELLAYLETDALNIDLNRAQYYGIGFTGFEKL